jgi:hypothetical protein
VSIGDVAHGQSSAASWAASAGRETHVRRVSRPRSQRRILRSAAGRRYGAFRQLM